MATTTTKFVDDNGNTVQMMYSATVAASAVTIVFAAVTGFTWVLTRLTCTTDKATANITISSNSTTVDLRSSIGASYHDTTYPLAMTRDGAFAPTGVISAASHDLTVALDVTAAGAMTLVAVSLPNRVFNAGK